MTTIIRTIQANNGEMTREHEILARDGRVYLHDTTDANYDGDVLLADDTDASINDALREGGFEIVADVREYRYATDGEMGVITAADFSDACRKLDAMFSPAILADGGFGWVEDHDGERYSVGRGRGR